MKLLWMRLVAGIMLGSPVRMFVMYGTRLQLFHGPWSDDSLTQFSSKFPEISSPPPNDGFGEFLVKSDDISKDQPEKFTEPVIKIESSPGAVEEDAKRTRTLNTTAKTRYAKQKNTP